MGQTLRSRSQCQKVTMSKIMKPKRGILMWNIKSLAHTVIKVIIWVKLQGQGHRVKNDGTHGIVLSQGILMWNKKALVLTVQK